jgi:small multidrug resistance family-3 protein
VGRSSREWTWGRLIDKFQPDRWDITGAVICLLGVAVIMYAPRS